jgi:hypothetical protein
MLYRAHNVAFELSRSIYEGRNSPRKRHKGENIVCLQCVAVEHYSFANSKNQVRSEGTWLAWQMACTSFEILVYWCTSWEQSKRQWLFNKRALDGHVNRLQLAADHLNCVGQRDFHFVFKV